MFEKSAIPPDNPMIDDIDQINRSIARVRSLLKDEVTIDSQEDFPMIQSQVEIFQQAHLRRALEFLDGAKHALDGGHALLAITNRSHLGSCDRVGETATGAIRTGIQPDEALRSPR